jgi:hypothetical protein
MLYMKETTIITTRRLVHHFKDVLEILHNEKELAVTQNGVEVCRILEPKTKPKVPDFANNAKAIFGDKIFNKNIVLEEREVEKW